jgi:hypothetical protein
VCLSTVTTGAQKRRTTSGTDDGLFSVCMSRLHKGKKGNVRPRTGD